ncbi:ubiquinol-cytochrome C reductase cytochrome C subunit [Nocardiopsis terrae]|uniref:Ubiquinol-cytochrome c reductase cytochrome c subunit n=1 Tax=Nocardiopsis terrae TaxID=372655 RepID=A0ABR9HE91_9ACTN|nr:ubiquinol-cytochrome c reductase cytochrome c subunit [Nocardiopsis terrae]GHC91905.1 ubiquinol-cytochrome C reductase cytochrome C subunit [Nocardiopsis terrae]
MKWITARRRHPLAGYVVVILALALFGVGYAALAPTSDQAQAQTLAAEAPSADEVDIAEGKAIFDQTCASCHNYDGSGTYDEDGNVTNGPDLREVGPAAIDFQVSTGRMPSMDPDTQMPRKPMAMSEEELDDLIAYYNDQIRTDGAGADIPYEVPGSAPERANFEDEESYEEALAEYEAEYDAYIEGADNTDMGMKLYLTNCAHCHSWSGGGGALTDGRWAPEIHDASPRQIYEAMVSGPGAMPMFSDGVIAPEEKQELISYVKTLQAEPNAGGIFDLERVGQVAEGFIGWTVGLSLIIACAIWITAKQRAHD